MTTNEIIPSMSSTNQPKATPKISPNPSEKVILVDPLSSQIEDKSNHDIDKYLHQMEEGDHPHSSSSKRHHDTHGRRLSVIRLANSHRSVMRASSLAHSFRSSITIPMKHQGWDEMRNVWKWRFQADLICAAQRLPDWLFPPFVFLHYAFKRDWGIAFHPLSAFAIYGDYRAMDLFAAPALAGVICGLVKHIFRSPRPFWIVPDVFLKQGVEEMSWATPSAHSAIASAFSIVLIYYDKHSTVNWIIALLVPLITMLSRLYLGVHWPQDVVIGAVIGVVVGLTICLSKVHYILLDFALHHYGSGGGLIYLVAGLVYVMMVYMFVLFLKKWASSTPVPDKATERYKLGVARALRILDDSNEKTRVQLSIKGTNNDDKITLATKSSTSTEEEQGIQKEQMVVIADEMASVLNLQTIQAMNSIDYLKDSDEIKDEEDLQKETKKGRAFVRHDVKFDPDTMERFWYNASNAFGVYSGFAVFTCLVSKENVQFSIQHNIIASIYGTAVTFGLIVSIRMCTDD